MRRPFLLSLLLLGAPLLGACGGGSSTGGADAGPFVPCEPTPPPCQEQAPTYLRLGNAVAPGLVTNAQEEADWVSEVDASPPRGSGGRTSYVYAKFDPVEGLQKLDLDDETAFGSTEWDIAFRRFVIRVNSGDSGPSCVQASRAHPAKSYEEVGAASDAVVWRADDFFTNACSFIPDGSGLDGPDTVLSSYYAMQACASMTGHVFMLQLRNGRHVKLVVTGTYTDSDQRLCERGEALPFFSAGHVRLRWSFVD